MDSQFEAIPLQTKWFYYRCLARFPRYMADLGGRTLCRILYMYVLGPGSLIDAILPIQVLTLALGSLIDPALKDHTLSYRF